MFNVRIDVSAPVPEYLREKFEGAEQVFFHRDISLPIQPTIGMTLNFKCPAGIVILDVERIEWYENNSNELGRVEELVAVSMESLDHNPHHSEESIIQELIALLSDSRWTWSD